MKFRKFILIGLLPILVTSCNPGSIKEVEIPVNQIDDKNRNYYEIFPIAFADSNADGKGDLRGIIEKFDYLKSFNYKGLWLTPVHPSETYHKYDVDNYYEIDPDFGTIADYDELVKLCHENDMTIILDLVLNHSSDDIEWFGKSYAAHARNKVDDPYYEYYNFKPYKGGSADPGYTIKGNLQYESQFWSGMPDLNLESILKNPDGYLAKEIKDIMKYWLIDRDIDGFRLDAVTSFFTGNIQKNKEILTWINTEAKKIKSDAYIVGEAWTSTSEITQYYETGIDSFFQFEDHAANGYIAQTQIAQNGSYPFYAMNQNLKTAKGGVPAPFVANHDTGRLIGAALGNTKPENVKFLHGILEMMNGATYNYYGDEVGMAICPPKNGEKAKDEDKRQPMPWGDKYQCKSVLGSTNCEDEVKYPHGTVKDQEKNPNSILNYVRKANTIRNQFMPIARGDIKEVYVSDDDALGVIEKTYKGEVVYVCINASNTKTKDYDFSQIGGEEVVGQLVALENTYIKKIADKKISIPPKGIAIIR